MSIRKATFNPPFNIVRASHVELGVRDLVRSRAFYVDCLGYLVTAEDANTLYLRGVGQLNHHPIVLRKRSDRAAVTIGFKLASEDALENAAVWFKRKNLPVSFPEVPFQGRTLRTVDPTGLPLDFYFFMDQREW